MALVEMLTPIVEEHAGGQFRTIPVNFMTWKIQDDSIDRLVSCSHGRVDVPHFGFFLNFPRRATSK